MKVRADGGLTPTFVRNASREVYFLQARKLRLIKIGVANDLLARLRSLMGASPDQLDLLAVSVCHEGGAMEARLHQRYARLRAHGEWFRPGTDLLNDIEAIALANPLRLKRVQAWMAEPTRHRAGRPKNVA